MTDGLNPFPGCLLVALPDLRDPNFARSVIYVFAHDDEDGTIGVILNRPSDLSLHAHLPEMSGLTVPPDVVFIGGPVQREIAITVADGPAGPVIVSPDEDAAGGPCRVYSGYSGWGPGQLSLEIAEGSWVVVESQDSDGFHADPALLWTEVLRRQPGVLGMLATFPRDLSSN